jgi:hypothetical protein
MVTVKPQFIVLVDGLEKEQWLQENDRCWGHSLNKISSVAIEIEGWFPENNTSGNNSRRFHCIRTPVH